MTRNKKKFNKFLKIVILIVVLLLAILFIANFSTNFLTIKFVEIKNNADCAKEDQIKTSSRLLGQNFFSVNKNSVEKSLKDQFICVKSVNLSKLFPNQIKLEVLNRQAIIKLSKINLEATKSSSIEDIATPSAELADETYVMDGEGVVFSKSPSEAALPTLYIDSDLSLGKRVDYATNYLKILQKLKTFNIKFDPSLALDNFFIIFPQFEQPKIIFRLDKADTQIASLQLILQKAKIDSAALEFIDLRFDKPIIRIAPKK